MAENDVFAELNGEYEEIHSSAPGKTTEEDSKKDGSAEKEPSFYRYAFFVLSALIICLAVAFVSMKLIASKGEEKVSLLESVLETTAPPVLSCEDGFPVNINTADADSLTALEGIGESRAKDIIEYRSEYGPFTDIEEIMNIPGIGEKTFEKIKDKICITDG